MRMFVCRLEGDSLQDGSYLGGSVVCRSVSINLNTAVNLDANQRHAYCIHLHQADCKRVHRRILDKLGASGT